jgi:HEPN domain-containing protein
MQPPRKISEAFLVESGTDFHAAKILFRSGSFARSVYLAQQSVEKALKAALALRSIFSTDHNLSPIFSAVYRDSFAEMDRLVVAVQSLERLGAKARFPLYHRDDLPIWMPSREFGRKEAASALTDCEFVYQAVRAYLVDHEGLEAHVDEP